MSPFANGGLPWNRVHEAKGLVFFFYLFYNFFFFFPQGGSGFAHKLNRRLFKYIDYDHKAVNYWYECRCLLYACTLWGCMVSAALTSSHEQERPQTSNSAAPLLGFPLCCTSSPFAQTKRNIASAFQLHTASVASRLGLRASREKSALFSYHPFPLVVKRDATLIKYQPDSAL